ncbi:MAG: hypothetical protein HDR15_02910 [Lachnospiraceae bacterium]|nr:hypothetical protein [Lachnospiraceae bacterium]
MDDKFKGNYRIEALIQFIALFIIVLSYVMTINSKNEFYQNAFLFIAPFTIEVMDTFFLKHNKKLKKISYWILLVLTGFLLIILGINVFFPEFIQIEMKYYYAMITVYPAKILANFVYLSFKIIIEKE